MNMKHVWVLIAVVVLALLLGVPAMAQDDEPVTPTGEQPVIDVTEVATVEATPEATVIVVEQPPVDEPDVTVINNNGFSFEQVALTVFGFVLTLFAGIRMFVVPVLKSNAELAKAAGDYIPQATFDKVIGITEGLQRWAETLTPNFKGDDEGLRLIRKEVDDLKLLLHPSTPTTNPLDPPYNISG